MTIQEWHDFCYKLPVLSPISIPRWTSQGTDTEFVELHDFSDASRLAYSAVVYIRVVTESGQITIKILMFKTKVAPIKTISIPNLELCAAALSTKLILSVVQSLQLDNMPIFCCTDSTIFLIGYRNNQLRCQCSSQIEFLQFRLHFLFFFLLVRRKNGEIFYRRCTGLS